MTDIEAAGIATTATDSADDSKRVSVLWWVIPTLAFWLWVIL